MYACLAVTCHLHFWQNDRDFLRATVVTRGWNGHRNKSQHRKSTLEKKILPPFQQGFEPATFQSRVRCSNHWAIPPPSPQFLRRMSFYTAQSCCLESSSFVLIWNMVITEGRKILVFNTLSTLIPGRGDHGPRIWLFDCQMKLTVTQWSKLLCNSNTNRQVLNNRLFTCNCHFCDDHLHLYVLPWHRCFVFSQNSPDSLKEANIEAFTTKTAIIIYNLYFFL